jgi:hypothetical protein
MCVKKGLLRKVHPCTVLNLVFGQGPGYYILFINLLDTKVIVVPLTLDKEVAKDLIRINEATANKWLKEPWDGDRVTLDIEHHVDIEVLNHVLMVKYPQMEHIVIDVGQSKLVPVAILRDDVSLDIVAIDYHAFHRLYLFH